MLMSRAEAPLIQGFPLMAVTCFIHGRNMEPSLYGILRMIDLKTMEHVDVSCLNDPEEADSYHSWSSEGRWIVFGSRRLDGRYTRLYIAYLDEEGNPDKPFLLPQEDPRYNLWRLKSYNVPEFIDGEVDLPDSVVKLFEPEK